MLSLREITVGSDLMSKDKKEKKRKKRMKKVIAYIIAAILIIAFNVLYLSRYFLGVYINYKRNDWETDRNFYAKNIKLDGIKLDKNGSKQFIYSSKKFKKEKANGNVFYYMKHKGNKIYASIKDYKKYVANCDEVTMYAKTCQYSYQSDKGKINATMTGNRVYFYPVSFSEKELKKIKVDIWKKCKKKIFVNKYNTGSSYNQCHLIYREDLYNQIVYHDWKKQKVCTDFSIKNNETNTYGNVKGESLITPGKYDRLYPDANMYPVNKTEKYDWKDKMMNKAADLYYDSDKKDTYFVIYIMSFILFLVFLDLIYTLFIGIPIGIISFLFIG